MSFFTAGRRDAEGGQELDEVRQLFLGRLLMDAVDERRFLLLDVARHGLVRREHEFLDDLVRHVPFGPDDVGHAALEVEHDLGLGQVEVDAAPFRPLRAQDRP